MFDVFAMFDVYTIEVALITAAIVTIIAGLLVYLFNSSLFVFKPEVWEGTPPVRNLTIMYKTGTGDYKKSGAIYDEIMKLIPDIEMIGLYYDDPEETPAAALRWAVGAVIAEGVEKVDKAAQGTLEAAGFKIHKLPCVDLAVLTEWDLDTKLSFMLLYTRVYPALTNYLKAKKLENAVGPCVEIYESGGEEVTVMFPLDHQNNFYVPEFSDKKN